jgi:hypothetical protein
MEKCDHCGADVDCENDQFYHIYSLQDFVLWCELCIRENEAILMEMNIPYEKNTYGIWSSYDSILALRRLTKERNEALSQGKLFSEPVTEKSFLAAKPIDEPRCKAEYYGTTCYCYDCNRINKNKNTYKNVFGYSDEERYGFH